MFDDRRMATEERGSRRDPTHALHGWLGPRRSSGGASAVAGGAQRRGGRGAPRGARKSPLFMGRSWTPSGYLT